MPATAIRYPVYRLYESKFYVFRVPRLQLSLNAGGGARGIRLRFWNYARHCAAGMPSACEGVKGASSQVPQTGPSRFCINTHLLAPPWGPTAQFRNVVCQNNCSEVIVTRSLENTSIKHPHEWIAICSHSHYARLASKLSISGDDYVLLWQADTAIIGNIMTVNCINITRRDATLAFILTLPWWNSAPTCYRV